MKNLYVKFKNLKVKDIAIIKSLALKKKICWIAANGDLNKGKKEGK